MINNINFDKAFCDLGASVNLMSLSVCKRLRLSELKLTTMVLQLANHSIRYPLDILEDIPIKVGDFVIPIDFVILEMNGDLHISIILGRSFLATVGVIIDVNNHKLSLEVDNNKIEFDLSKTVNPPFFENICCRVDCLQ